jgi:hypothetical protein
MSEENGCYDFAACLARHITHSGYHVAQVARLSGVPRTTLAGWLGGETHKPRQWQDVAHVARVLRLSKAETDELLRWAGYPTLSQLKMQTQDRQELNLLSTWQE